MRIDTDRLILISCEKEMCEKRGYEREHILKYLSVVKQNKNLEGWGPWLIFKKENGKLIGDGGFKGIVDDDGIVEIGYSIVASAQNSGYGTEAVESLMKWAYGRGAEYIIAECRQDNIGSIRVLEKVGMDKIATQNQMIFWQKRRRGSSKYNRKTS
ncbi:MAG: GNAT family N-acetyltransferase [Tissierellales bacterium]|jgi:ribosomal-protein-alanine N-acetyltransferase|nr:GNAT family N-acetyltransferase [Tissierellales bacterium]